MRNTSVLRPLVMRLRRLISTYRCYGIWCATGMLSSVEDALMMLLIGRTARSSRQSLLPLDGEEPFDFGKLVT